MKQFIVLLLVIAAGYYFYMKPEKVHSFMETRSDCSAGWEPGQRASRVVLGTSGLRACGEGECVIALES